MTTWGLWLIGFAVSVGVGSIVIRPFMSHFDKYIQKMAEEHGEQLDREVWNLWLPAWFTGLIERFAFTIFVAIDLPAVGALMAAWIGAKMFDNWQHVLQTRAHGARSRAFLALLGNLLSMLFATLGGQICKVDLRDYATFQRSLFGPLVGP